MAIGRPVSLTSNVASKAISTTATASQTTFTVSGGYRINQIAVYKNGIRLVDGTQFTATDGATVILTSGASDGDKLEFQIFDDFRVADAILRNNTNQTINGDLTVTGTLSGAFQKVGILSAGTAVGTAQTLNFIGAGNTFLMNGDTVEISIAGGGGSGVAATITVADESADTTCFPVFVTDATGDLNPKSGTNLTFNSSSGALSATSFVGNVTGDVTGIADTATNVTVADESSDTSCNILFTTGASGNLPPKSGTNLTFDSATGTIGVTSISATSATFSSDVSIGGTLTYSDVTNIDSVGIITAQAGIEVTGGNVNIGASPATNSQLTIRAASPHLSLYATPGSNTSQLNFGDTDDHDIGNIKYDQNDNSMQFTTNALERLRINSSGNFGINQTSIDGTLHVKGSGGHGIFVLEAGGTSGSTNQLYFQGHNHGGASIGEIHFEETATDQGAIVFKTNGGSVTEKLRIASSGLIGLGGANYGTSGQVITSNGTGSAPTWQDSSGGITSAIISPSANTIVTLDLATNQHHDVRLSAAGICTITCTGGNPGDSHSVVITQPSSGIATVGFSTYFLFPSGSIPSMSEGSSKVDLVSFTVKTKGSSGVATALLASSGLNYSN